MAATLGQLIRQRRMELGLTQEELAERLGEGVRQAEISRLERNGVALPRRARLEQIARALDVPLGVLLARSGWVGAQEAFAPAEEPPEPVDIATEHPLAPKNDRPNLDEDVPQLSDAISRAREVAQRTEDTLRKARVTFDEARRRVEERRNGDRRPPPPERAS
jgi:transcriptional regulator with XRE-family HTH domain